MRVGRGGKGGGLVYSVCAWPSSYDHRPSHPYYAGTEHVGFSPTRQAGAVGGGGIITLIGSTVVADDGAG